MTIKNVKAFYERLAVDEAFRVQINSAKSKPECSQIAQEAGYYFTQEEFEEFTEQLVGSVTSENTLDELSERELEVAVGGAASSILGFKDLAIQPKYGSVRLPL